MRWCTASNEPLQLVLIEHQRILEEEQRTRSLLALAGALEVDLGASGHQVDSWRFGAALAQIRAGGFDVVTG
jgi:hypothetical protein